MTIPGCSRLRYSSVSQEEVQSLTLNSNPGCQYNTNEGTATLTNLNYRGPSPTQVVSTNPVDKPSTSSANFVEVKLTPPGRSTGAIPKTFTGLKDYNRGNNIDKNQIVSNHNL